VPLAAVPQVCLTEREKFVVPLRAVGHRAVLDFPDVVKFGGCPVKYASTKVLLVRNIGDASARFTTRCSGPFSLSPAEAEVPSGGSVQVVCTFDPSTLGEHQGEAVVT
jgi:hydrocephalus-inducing protein